MKLDPCGRGFSGFLFTVPRSGILNGMSVLRFLGITLKPLDYLAFLAAAAALVFVFSFAADSGGDILQVRIGAGDGTEWLYPLDSEIVVHIPGPLGETEVEIRDGQVWVIDSPCVQKICIASSPVSRAGTWIACLPNKVFVRIEGTVSDGIDAGTF